MEAHKGRNGALERAGRPDTGSHCKGGIRGTAAVERNRFGIVTAFDGDGYATKCPDKKTERWCREVVCGLWNPLCKQQRAQRTNDKAGTYKRVSVTICDGCDGILGIRYGIENIVTIVTSVTEDERKDGLID